MCLGSAPARYWRGREGTSSEKVKKRLRALRTAESASRNRPQTRNGRVRCARDDRTQHPQRPVVRVFLEPRGARRRCARPRQRRHTALGFLGGADLGQPWCRGRCPDHARRRPPEAPPPWSPAPPVQQQPTASGVTPPVGVPGVALGVAGGRPRVADEPPDRPQDPGGRHRGFGHRPRHRRRTWCVVPAAATRTQYRAGQPVAVRHRRRDPLARGHDHLRADGRSYAAGHARPDALQSPDLHRQDGGGGPGTRRDRRSPA